ncbi:PAS domain-containing protein [Hymenobacter sp. BRD67]|uniref:PAS domain-containing protein n=1 Tax=Hymenobacter sp. BRD67 TaxID=2675877 RepID=UPI0015662299|nr:PAS domain-containing protein [Hymenobacter sp. BRD67]QKG53570.1 PAS domain-containing protein [Hymenobacter sp. BRD67]
MTSPTPTLPPAAPHDFADLELELRQARAEAATARQQLAALTDSLSEGLLLIGADGYVLLINDQFCRLIGLQLPAAQWLGIKALKLAGQVRECVADPVAYDEEITQELSETRRSGPLLLRDGRTLERESHRVNLGDTSGWLLSYRDVTQHRQMEGERDAQRRFYETILDEVPVEIAVLDEQRRYVYVNPQAVPDAEHRAWLPGRTLREYCARYGFPMALAEYRDRMFEQAEASTEPVDWDDCTPVPGGEVHHQRQFKLLSGPGRACPTCWEAASM